MPRPAPVTTATLPSSKPMRRPPRSDQAVDRCNHGANRGKERTMATTALDPDRVEKELADVTNSVTFDARPFMQDFAAGRVPKENLARFAASYCFQVDNFKRFVAQVYANAEPRDVRELMLENLWEEHGEGDNSRDHAELVARFGRALGADLPTPYDHEPIPESRQWAERILKLCLEEEFVVGLAALSYGIEARTRTMAYLGAIYRDKYGISEDD